MSLRGLPEELKNQVYEKLALTDQARWKVANAAMKNRPPYYEDRAGRDRLLGLLRLMQRPDLCSNSLLKLYTRNPDIDLLVFSTCQGTYKLVTEPQKREYAVDTPEKAALLVMVLSKRLNLRYSTGRLAWRMIPWDARNVYLEESLKPAMLDVLDALVSFGGRRQEYHELKIYVATDDPQHARFGLKFITLRKEGGQYNWGEQWVWGPKVLLTRQQVADRLQKLRVKEAEVNFDDI